MLAKSSQAFQECLDDMLTDLQSEITKTLELQKLHNKNISILKERQLQKQNDLAVDRSDSTEMVNHLLKSGLSPTSIASKIGVSYMSVHSYSKGWYFPKVDNYWRLKKLYERHT